MLTRSALRIYGTSIEMLEGGTGKPLLFLHAGIGADPGISALTLLTSRFRVLAPSHPGFGTSERPKSFTSVDDLSYFYLDLLEELKLSHVVLCGASFGAWIAAEMAIKSCERLDRLIMVDPIGIKVSGREVRDIPDIFAMTAEQMSKTLFADPRRAVRDYKSMPEADVIATARNRESLARFAWSPYMHDPKLKSRLHRISVPTLFLRGSHDQFTSEPYVRSYSEAVTNSLVKNIDDAGHLPHLEQPEGFAEAVAHFAGFVSSSSQVAVSSEA